MPRTSVLSLDFDWRLTLAPRDSLSAYLCLCLQLSQTQVQPVTLKFVIGWHQPFMKVSISAGTARFYALSQTD